MALLTNINGKFSVSDAGAVTFNNAFTFPTADGTANYVLKTNGSGQLAWAADNDTDYDYWILQGDSAANININSTNTLKFVGGTYIDANATWAGGANPRKLTINHENTSRSDTTSTDAPAFGGTFEAVTSITTNTTGHVTAIDVSTVTIPNENGDITGSGAAGRVTFWTGTKTVSSTSGFTWDNGNNYLSINKWTASTATPAAMLHLFGKDNNIDVPAIIIEGRDNPNDTRLKIAVKDPQVRFLLDEGSDAVNGYGLMTFETTAQPNTAASERGGFDFDLPGGTAMTIVNTGNVGIGTTSPSTKFQVEGAPANGVYLSYLYNSATHNSANGLNVQTSSNNILTYGLRVNTAGDSNALAVMGNGSVGIGTASPVVKLAVKSSQEQLTLSEGDLRGATFDYRSSTGNLNIATNGINARTNPQFTLDLNGKVGIGVTSPSSYNSRGRNLVVGGSGDVGITIDCSLSNSGTLLFADGTGGTAGYRGIIEYDHANDSMTFSTSATAQMRVDSSGNVGIGTTSPDSILEISKAQATGPILKITEPTSGNGTLEGGPGNNLGVLGFVSADTSTSQGNLIRASIEAEPGEKAYGTGGLLTFNTMQTYAGTGTLTDLIERMRITSGGNVGIGTTSPNAKLDVNGAVVISPNTDGKDTFTLTTNASNDARLLMKSDTTTKVDIQANGDSYFNGGDVGIGTTSPAARLNVSGVGQANNPVLAVDVTNSDAFNHGVEIFDGNLTTGETVLMAIGHSGSTKLTAIFGFLRNENSLDQNLATIGFWGANNLVTVSGAGNMGIGTGTAPATYKLHIKSFNNVSIFEDTSDAAGATFILFNKPNVFAMGSITRNGSANSVSYNTGSDYRLKEDLKDFNALDLVNDITAYDYKWKNTEQRDYGFVAHELKEVLPNVVVGEKDGEIMQGVDYSKLTPVLLKAIQEQQEIINDLKSRIEQLEN